MKKLVYLAALLGVAAGSFAFLPKAEEPGGYMMVVGILSQNNGRSVFVINPDGTRTVENISGYSMSKLVEAKVELHQAELMKLQELRKSGWQVISTTNSLSPNIFQATYLLEKR